jgi:hypothetical protein
MEYLSIRDALCGLMRGSWSGRYGVRGGVHYGPSGTVSAQHLSARYLHCAPGQPKYQTGRWKSSDTSVPPVLSLRYLLSLTYASVEEVH